MYQAPSISFRLVFAGSDSDAGLFDLTINSDSILNPAFPSTGTAYDAWCLDKVARIDVPGNYTGRIYSSYEIGALKANVASLAGSPYLDNLDNINWLLNFHPGSTPGISMGEVQAAIWQMLGQDWRSEANYLGQVDQADVDSLVAQALANDGYVPDAGEAIAIVVDASESGPSGQQPLIITTRAAKLGDRVFHDANGDGVQDAGEQGIAGATVQLVRDMDGDGLFDSAGERIATTTTDANGHYEFRGLTPGLAYQVLFTTPESYAAVSPRQAGGDAQSDSDGLLSNVVVLAPGETNYSVDAGFYRYASLGDRVWLDADRNGAQDGNEPGVANVTVHLLDAAGQIVATQTTGQNGEYLFLGLQPGSYRVQFLAPEGYGFTGQDQADDTVDSDADPFTGLTDAYTLASGDDLRSVDAGLVQKQQPLARIGDRVWEDLNANGVQDPNEPGIAGAPVVLLDAGGNVVASTVTDGDGLYSFDVPAGTYSVQVQAPAGSNYLLSPRDAGSDDTADSDADASGTTGQVTVQAGELNDTLDIGAYRLAQLGDRVWVDTNKNGVQDGGEAGLSGVTVKLLDASGQVVATQTTGDDGRYLFNNLVPGRYSVAFDQPAGYDFTTLDAGGDDGADSDANPANGQTATYTLNSGDDLRTVDAGVVLRPPKTGSLSGTVLEDLDNNGSGDRPIAGVTIVLRDATGTEVARTTTGTDGRYEFTNLPPGTYTVQQTNLPGYNDVGDSDGGNPNLITATVPAGGASTGNDFVDDRPASLGDRVWLDGNKNGQQDDGELGLSGVTVKLLDANGQVVATQTTGNDGRYLFSNLDAGQYSVAFVKPEGYEFTTADTGPDASDSDANVGTGVSPTVTLQSGDDNRSVDAGLVLKPAKLAHIGNRVWEDSNANGVQDAGEQGIAGATVVLRDAKGNTVQTTLSDANGNYGFDVAAGTYSVKVMVPASSGYVATVQKAGGNAETDSDINAAGETGPITVAAGEVNNSIDMGGYRKASLGDRVWLDANGNGQQDTGEQGVGGVTVKLLNAAGAVVATQSTDSQGSYLFSNLVPGQYSVQFVKPAGYSFTTADTGADGSDSDANVSTGVSAAVTLQSGENNRSVDAGLVKDMPKLAHIGNRVWEDSNANGVQDAGEQGIAGATVVLRDAKGNTVQTTLSDANGNYGFDVVAGTYSVKVMVPASSGYVATVQKAGGNAETDSDINAAGETGPITVAAGEVNNSIDMGGYRKACLGDRVWEDANGNGVQDAGELGLAGIQVKLISASTGSVLATTTTNASGNYSFANLVPGDYRVQVQLPTGYYASTADQGGDDARDSDINASGLSNVVTLSSGQTLNTLDAGLYRKASLGDRVWSDANHNGIQDAGEGGIAGIKVTLWNAAGTQQLASTTTNSSGNYQFSGLNPGQYLVQFDKSDVVYKPGTTSYNLNGWSWAIKDAGTNDAVDSDVSPGVSNTPTARTGVITLASGQHDGTVDAGITPIVIDLDGDGIQTVARDQAGGTFDLFGNGQAIASGWVSKGDGLLAIDRNGNGRIDDISELFGGLKQGDGFAQLAALDSNGDGRIDSADEAFAQLRIWRDADGNHSTDAGELMTLAEAGIASLSTGYAALPALDAQGNLHLERGSAARADGSVVDMTDVYFNVSADDAAAAGVSLPSMADLLGDDRALDGLLGTGPVQAHPAGLGLVDGDALPAGEAAETLRQLAALSEAQSHAAMVA